MKRSKLAAGVYLLVAVCWTASSMAQPPAPGAAGDGGGGLPAVDDPSLDPFYDPALTALDLRGAVLDDDSAVVVGVDEDTATASLQLTKAWRRHKLAATVSTPVNKETGNATFLGSDGQTDATKLKVEHSYIWWPQFELYNLYEREATGAFAGKELLEQLIDRQARVCLALAERLRQARSSGLPAGTWNERFEPLYQKVVDFPTVAEVGRYLNVNPLTLDEAESKRLADVPWFQRSQKFVRELGDGTGPCPELVDLAGPLNRIGILPRAGLLPPNAERRAWFVGTQSTIGRKDFAFLDRAKFDSTGEVKTTSDREAPWSVGGRVGLIFLTETIEDVPESALILSISREQGFKAADQLTFCQDADDLVPLESCKTFAGAPPGGEDATLVSVEYRMAGRKVSWSPRAYYRSFDSDAKSEDELGVEVPIWFLTNKDGGFQGGLVLGWSDQDDDGSIAVFVGRKFSVF